MEKRDPLELAQLIVRGSYINFGKQSDFEHTTPVYQFSNEDITSYFHHLGNKKKVLTVIGSGGQILNGALAGTKNFDCFDISIFPEYYLYLQIASVIALTKEEYLKFYFSCDREVLFCDDLYDKISEKLRGKYKEFWDTLYMFDDGIDIHDSLLFRHDTCLEKVITEFNPYLQENNYEKLRAILQTEPIVINPIVGDITKVKFSSQYDLVNLSNILAYIIKDLEKYIEFLKDNFNLTDDGEIINYFFSLDPNNEKRANELLSPNGYVEELGRKRLLVYKK